MQAHERIQLIATDSIRNAAGGIIAGRDVTAIAINGDIINERSVTTHQSSRGDSFQHRQDIVDSAARIEASNDLLLSAGRDILNIGGTLSAGGDAALLAGRDLLIASQQEQSAMAQTGRRSTTTQQSVTQLASDVQVGGDLSLGAGRDIAIIASTVTAGGNMALKAEGDITIAAAANESHFEHHRKGGGKQVDIERTSIIQQGAELSAGGNFISQSGGDTTLISSNIAAGQQAYLYAGGNLNLLAAQDVEYDLYDKKEKGSFGRRETRRDEVTDVRHVGSSITAGGDLSLISEGDQLYQNARLQSGNDLTLDAGGAITFEAVKDLHQESHERSKSDWAWNAAKGKGTTDETLIQSQLIAQGNLAIRAADGIQIDIKEIDQNTVSQTIDAMVQADPDLAWLKQMEAQGDIDWRTVKEVHDSFDYSHSGLGVGAQLIVAIVVSYLTAGATSAALNSMASASAGSGSVMASAGSTAMVNAGTAVGKAAAGWGNVAATAAITSAASNAAVSTINNRGDLGAVFKDVTSSDAMKNYAVGGITAGVTSGVLDKTFGVTGDNINKVTKGFDLSSATDVGKFGMYLGAQGATQAAVSTAVYGGSLSDNLSGALTAQGQHLLQAVMFNWVGNVSEGRWDEGSPQKIAFHALVGGMLSEATGGDFATGAAAAGASEALIERLSGVIKGDKSLELVSAQMIGIIAAAAVDGDVTKGAEIARNATAYNRQLHPTERELAKELAERSGGKYTAEEIEEQMRLAGIKGTDIHAATDIVSQKDARYDLGGTWVKASDGYMIQLFGDANPEIIAFIRSNADIYSWAPGIESGFFRPTPGDWTAASSNAERDRLTGYALDENGGYRVPITVDGVVHAPRFHPCGDTECLAGGANIDFSDPATLQWIRTVDTKTADQISIALALASVGAPAGAVAGLSYASTAAGLLSSYLREDLSGFATSYVVSAGFTRYAIARGLSEIDAARLTEALNAAGFWNNIGK